MAYKLRLTNGLQKHDPSKAFQGYTLFAPFSSNDAWLIDMEGRIVHHWTTPYTPAQHGKLLPNGNLLWPQKGVEPNIPVGGVGSEIVELDWDGKVVWSHKDDVINHDFVRMENGNTIYNRYIPIPDNMISKIKGGVPNSEAEGKIWGSALREVGPDGKIIWEWNMYEHLDPEKDSQCPLCPRSIWGYINSVFVMKDGNILCTFRFQNQAAIIEKSTGKVLWRWGDKHEVGHPHCVSELDNGNILLFDNGLHRCSPNRGAHELSHSRVIEVDPKTDKIVWMYRAPNGFDFYSSICGGAQRLPNGNTLICESTKGRFFEVTPDCGIVWEYLNPFLIDRSDYWGWLQSTCVFQAHRYALDYPGLKGKNLDPEQWKWGLEKADVSNKDDKQKTLDRLEKLGY